MAFPSHPALKDYTGFLLRRASAESFTAFSEIVGAYGLHPMHFGMLNILDASGPISQGELSRRTGVDPSSMVARMDVLEEQGLVERARSEEDRRSYELRLTRKGSRVLAELREKAEAHGDRFFSPLSAAERRELHRLLKKLVDGQGEAAPPGAAG